MTKFEVELEWRGNELWLGPCCVGAVRKLVHPRGYWYTVWNSVVSDNHFDTEAAARDALWSAAVELLTKDET